MIKLIEDNQIYECIQLMHKSTQDNNYQPYDRNERCWIEHLSKHIAEQGKGDPRYLAIGDYASDGSLRGFMLASAFMNFYTQEWVMDVVDCIVNHDYNNTFTVTRLFNYMIDHVEKHGGNHWRADSIRAGDKAIEYTEFLAKKYNAIPFHGVHGRVDRR
ncbi:hypothetical protein OAV41_01765 [Planctomycetota bacterium]|nr:hypothetical protein [Planctomycetota bacterium]